MENNNHADPFDRHLHARQAQLASGMSPAAAEAAYLDWVVHFMNSPGKQAEMMRDAAQKSVAFSAYLAQAALGKAVAPAVEPLAQDHRFAAPEWQKMPFAAIYQSFLMLEQTWHAATSNVEGVSKHHLDMADFAARQILDMMSPSNFPATNPEVLAKIRETGGMNLVHGFQNFLEDWQRAVQKKPPVGVEEFRVGKEVAATPGKVIYRNHLIELIQYTPTTETVRPEPILIVPAWIMKYYILDLSPHNSMVKYLVDQGHTVFMISWRNPTEEDRNLGFNDYIADGVVSALEAVRKIVPDQKVHSVGYCIGGTLLSIAAATLGRDGKDWLASMTLFAAQTDFTEAGELMLFIDESQVSFLEDMMRDQGYLDAKQMVGAFQMLHTNDLVWSRVVHDYLMGERRPMFDLMAWNADATRMPYRMHSEYLRHLFLNNDFIEGRYVVGEGPVTLSDIHVPIFEVGAEKDHVAPWKSVFKINLLADTDVTFLLTSGGHNAGIISEPGHPHRHFRISTTKEGETYVSPDDWLERTPVQDGSWWPTWQAWLSERSGKPVKPPAMGNSKADLAPICDAPGAYVLEK